MTRRQPRCVDHPADWYLDHIRQGRGFTLTRWGDSEILSICGVRRKPNKDGMPFTEDASIALRQSLLEAARSPEAEHFIAVEPAWADRTDELGDRVHRVYDNFDLYDRELHHACAFHALGVAGRMHEAVAEFQKHPFLVAGPEFYFKITHKLKCTQFFLTGHGVWGRRREVLADLQQALRPLREPAVVLVAASLAANWIVCELYKEFGTSHFLLDWGSAFDPYCGRLSRSYFTNHPEVRWEL